MHQIALTVYGSPKHDVGDGLEYLPCSGHPYQRTLHGHVFRGLNPSLGHGGVRFKPAPELYGCVRYVFTVKLPYGFLLFGGTVRVHFTTAPKNMI